ncbi:hypothetical protein SUGI_0637500 [Cryptomeria japonica]|nr:hypothetical protein SUGI_0637500 [Cryptomeria japonica]
MVVALQIPPYRRTWRVKSACKLQRVMAFYSATEHPSPQQILGALIAHHPKTYQHAAKGARHFEAGSGESA